MKHFAPTERGQSNWRALTEAEQNQVVYWAASRIARMASEADLGSDVVEVACGKRLRQWGRGSRIMTNEPCLVIIVRKKLSPTQLKRIKGKPVGDYIQLKVPLDRGQRVIAIPTDVMGKGNMPRAQADRQAIQAKSMSQPNRIANGSFCALVKEQNRNNQRRYLLTCNHVACLSIYSPDLSVDLPSSCYSSTGRRRQTLIGTTLMGKNAQPFAPGLDNAIDAALVQLNPDGKAFAAHENAWHVQPRAWARNYQELSSFSSAGISLLGRRANPLSGRFERIRFNYRIRYGPANGPITGISEVMECRLKYGYKTRPGDSGGAIISASGTLLGMHIAGIGRMSYAIPAYRLLSKNCFFPPIILAVD